MLIKIKNLRLKTIIGIHDWEQTIDREMVINAKIETNFDKSLTSDNIEDTINYDVIISKIRNLVENNRFKLIEKLTQKILDTIMEDSRISYCQLEVDKVGVFDFVDSFSITIEQRR